MLKKITKESLYMNVATYVYIVHSDINENNIYAEFATEEEAIDYARRHKDELTYVDKVDAALDKDGEILEIFDERTIWVYDEEDEEEDEEEINEFDTDFEDEESEGWSVCVVTPDDGDSDWEHFGSESEARDYFNNYTSYESGREVEVQLYGPDGMEDSYTIGADEDLDESLLEKITISEGIKLRTREEQDEFFRLCDEIGIYTAKDLINFKKEVDCTDENILQALRDYRAELGPDFKIANPELEREMAKKYEDIDFDGLVEELEEHEDMVECKECYDLVSKESCIKGEHGYVCEKCHKSLTESISELTPEQLAEMDTYLRSGKDLLLDDFEEEHEDFAIDVVSGELSFNEDTNTFDFRLSIYHASEDNNAEYADYHTDEEDYNFDSIEEVYDEFPQYLIDIYNWNFVKTEAIKMTRDELMDKEGTDDVELINAGRPEEERVELVEVDLTPRKKGDPVDPSVLNNPSHEAIRYNVFYGDYYVARSTGRRRFEGNELQDTDIICVFKYGTVSPYEVLDLMTVKDFKDLLVTENIDYKLCNYEWLKNATAPMTVKRHNN
jgi:hypothetical protein